MAHHHRPDGWSKGARLMGIGIMSPLFAILALLAVSGGVGLAAGLAQAPIRRVVDLAVPAAWVVATAATLGSLYYSEIVGFEPCRLCWFQRIAMYPLVVILGVAAVRRDRSSWLSGAILSGMGLAISSWHILVQAMPQLESSSCSLTTPCSARLVEVFGFVSIPVMAGSGFLLVLVLMLHARRSPQ